MSTNHGRRTYLNRTLVTNQKEKKYFIHNKTRIIITEHFNENGKPLSEIIEDAVKLSCDVSKSAECSGREIIS